MIYYDNRAPACQCHKCRGKYPLRSCPYRELANRLYAYKKFKLSRRAVADIIIKYVTNGDVDIVNALIKGHPELESLVENILLLI